MSKIKNFQEFLKEMVHVQVQPVQDQSLQPQVQPVQPVTQSVQEQPKLDINKINKKLNFTYVDKDTNTDKIKQICESAKLPENQKYIYGVVVKPEFVSESKKYLDDSDIKTISVISFPDGEMKNSEKMKEIQNSISHGADEVYVVMEYNKLIDVMKTDIEKQTKILGNIQSDIRNCVEYCKEKSITIGIIIEMEALIDKRNISKAVEICKNSNVDLIVTSTGTYNKNSEYTFENKINDVNDIITPIIQGIDNINIVINGGINSPDKISKCLSNDKIQRISTSIIPQTLLNSQVPPKYKPQPQDELIVQQSK